MWWIPLSLSGCGPASIPAFLDAPPPEGPARPAGDPIRRGTPLARPEIEGTFTLPASSRPGGELPPDTLRLGPFRLVEERPRADVYRAAMPVQASLLPSAGGGTHRFGSKAPPGMVVNGPVGPLRFERGAREAGTWGFDEEGLLLGVSSGANPPDPRKYSVVFPKATRAEQVLNLASSGLDPATFARRTVTVGGRSYTGLLLPAPAEAAFAVTVPAGGVVSFDARILAPAVASSVRSDGAWVAVVVREGGVETVVLRAEVHVGGDPTEVHADLSAFGGRAVTLVLRTEPGGDSTFDYVHLEAPALYAPRPDPERVAIVFVDTLRADHLGFMGYTRRPTSPLLDHLAAHATVFARARTVAPWTLPSARAMLSGREPEAWSDAETLAEAFSAAGWRTDAVVSNAFLSQPFDVHRGWDSYDFEHLRDARDVVARAKDALVRHGDRDQLLLVHFMEPHLPYAAPWTYRHIFAGWRPDGIRSMSRAGLLPWSPARPGFDAVQAYVTDRYDQQIRYLDDTLRALVAALGPRATIAVVADHGEELWDHGGVEHGHALWEELLDVPFVVRSPALPAGRVEAPVSLLDLTPTLRVIGRVAPDPDADGRSLVGAAWGEDPELAALEARPLAFGRLLYGPDGWGVAADAHTWWDRAGVQSLYDLRSDPGQRRDLAPKATSLEAWPAHLSAALGRPVRPVWRIHLRAEQVPFALDLTVSCPSGFSAVWLGADPRGRFGGIPELREGVVHLAVPAESEGIPAIYVVPPDPYVPEGLAVSLVGGTARLGRKLDDPRPIAPSHDPPAVLDVGDARLGASVEIAWTPEPFGTAAPAYHPEMEDQLRELGYLDDGP